MMRMRRIDVEREMEILGYQDTGGQEGHRKRHLILSLR